MKLDSGDAGRGSGIPVRDLREDARALSREEFEDRHGSAFLLLSAAELAMSRGRTPTEVCLDDGPRRSESTVGLSLVAFPVRRGAKSAGHLITVGRTEDNDVVIPDLSISRVHAFVTQGPRGEWLIQDAGSTNGTTLIGRSVPQQGTGGAAEMKSGDDLRLGQVELTFLGAEALVAFAMKVER
jgi:hypothetical protein